MFKYLVIFIALILIDGVMGQKKDYYSWFGMTRETFSKERLGKEYRKLAKKLHPDKRPGDKESQEELMKITEAYETLDDDDKRRVYDIYGEDGVKSGAHGSGGFHPEDIFERFFGGGGFHFNFGGGGRGQPQRRRTQDNRVELKVSLDDVYKGADLKIRLNRQKTCSHCGGVGAKNPSDVHVCGECRGTGVKVMIRQLGMGMIQQFQTTCDKCNGKGRVYKSVCPHCRGQKVVREDEELHVHLEPGCPNGHMLKFSEAADELPDHVTGDLYLSVVAEPHPKFRREGQNLYCDITISLVEALLGFEKTMKHMDGRDVRLSRSEVTQPVKDEGMPAADKYGKGDLYVAFKVVLPSKLTNQQKDLFSSSGALKEWKEEL